MNKVAGSPIFYALFLVFLTVIASCSKDEIDLSQPLTIEQINQHISKSLSETGDFNWEDASDHLAWSAIIRGEGTATIGYSNYPYLDEELEPEIIQQIINARTVVLANVLELEKAANPSLEMEDVLLSDGESYTHMVLVIHLMQTVTQLRKMPEVRFFEPNYNKYPA